MVGRQEEHPACKNLTVSLLVCWWLWFGWSYVQKNDLFRLSLGIPTSSLSAVISDYQVVMETGR